MKKALVLAFAFALSCVAAQAQVRYTFRALDANRSFSLTTSTFLNTSAGELFFQASQLGGVSSSTPFRYASFSSFSANLDRVAFAQDDVGGGGTAYFYYFDPASFTTLGTYTTTLSGASPSSNVGTLSVEAVPEPATMAALGLGALAMLRRRKRA